MTSKQQALSQEEAQAQKGQFRPLAVPLQQALALER